MKKNGFFIIERFMVDDLKLKGNELIIYGIIYGFSKNNSSFEGSLNYLAGWIGSSKQTVITVIKSLMNKGLIQRVGVNKSMRTYIYKALDNQSNILTDESQKNITCQSKDFTEIGQNIIPNNIDNNINNKIDDTLYKDTIKEILKDWNINYMTIVRFKKPIQRVKDVVAFAKSNNKGEGWIVSAIRDDYKLYNLDKNLKKIGEQTYKESEVPNDNIELYKHMGFI